ncbi:heavy-metal-associated domain-containing protein [Polaribacter sp. Hel_I_88]|uniref:heavy-metal-associated domain-containing protein n=1 Tax=Polaribacter sp. Hel_I_88 TaxID=1250006 RepID=UPI00047C5EBC|nr:cation transporter [Polaribacter sp. Hel_I_88]
MKKVFITLAIILAGFTVQAQEVKKDKNAKISMKVDGICGMCKKRIETAALKTKGVKFAIWSPTTHQLNVIMDERKTDVKTIQDHILEVGHDILLEDDKKIVAKNEAYESVHPCCKYRDEEIVKDHEGELKKVKKQK